MFSLSLSVSLTHSHSLLCLIRLWYIRRWFVLSICVDLFRCPLGILLFCVLQLPALPDLAMVVGDLMMNIVAVRSCARSMPPIRTRCPSIIKRLIASLLRPPCEELLLRAAPPLRAPAEQISRYKLRTLSDSKRRQRQQTHHHNNNNNDNEVHNNKKVNLIKRKEVLRKTKHISSVYA